MRQRRHMSQYRFVYLHCCIIFRTILIVLLVFRTNLYWLTIPGSDLSYVCLDCPTGFEGDGATCTDINEVGYCVFTSSSILRLLVIIAKNYLRHTKLNFSHLFLISVCRL